MVSSCGIDGWECCRYQLAGGSLAGKESRPQTSTMSGALTAASSWPHVAADASTAGPGVRAWSAMPAAVIVRVIARSFRSADSLDVTVTIVGIIQLKGDASLTAW